MHRFTGALGLLSALLLAPAASAEMLDARIGLGTQAGDFFDAASGFTQGDTSHTNTASFTDGTVQVDFTMTVQAFDTGGAPAGLQVNNQAAGVELGVSNDQVDSGESIKFTFDDISVSQVGPPPTDPASYSAILGSIRLTAWDDGTDSYTYTGVGSATDGLLTTGTLDIDIDATIDDGDMFTITGAGGAFRILYVSNHLDYNAVPEPTALAAALLGVAAIASRRRAV